MVSEVELWEGMRLGEVECGGGCEWLSVAVPSALA
jgi:hypothetical protein